MTNKRVQVKQLVVLSGKGGTGKTSITAGLIHLASESIQSVFVDADVDAANLSIVTEALPFETHPFRGSQSAVIDQDLCNQCGICNSICRFNAVNPPRDEESSYSINGFLCDGCHACVQQCPQSAIAMFTQQDGEWYHSHTPYGRLVHAELFPGAENTGKLVTLVKQHARLYAEDHQIPLMIVDGPPGIGCPVISASAGADLALLVAEPGVSGLHDLERIIQTLKHFKVPMLVCINKADLFTHGTEAIIKLARDYGCVLVSKVPFDVAIPEAMIKGLPVTRMSPDSSASLAIASIWKQIETILFNNEKAI